jgi:NADH-quinone oxidoreductase subunit L
MSFDAAPEWLEAPVMAFTLAGVGVATWLAWRLYVGQPALAERAAARAPRLHRGSLHKWYVDEAYEAAVVRPVYQVSRQLLWAVVDVHVVDGFANGCARAAQALASWYGRVVQVGHIQAYALAIAIGAVVLVFTVGA